MRIQTKPAAILYLKRQCCFDFGRYFISPQYRPAPKRITVVSGLQQPQTKSVCGLQQFMKIRSRLYIDTTDSLKLYQTADQENVAVSLKIIIKNHWQIHQSQYRSSTPSWFFVSFCRFLTQFCSGCMVSCRRQPLWPQCGLSGPTAGSTGTFLHRQAAALIQLSSFPELSFLTNYLFAYLLDNFCSKSLVIFKYRKQIVLSLKTLFKICFF